MKVLALDIGKRGAFARNYGNRPRLGLIDCTRNAKDRPGISLMKLHRALEAQPVPDLIVHEVLIGTGKGKRLLHGFGAVVELYATRHFIPVQMVPAATLKKWATGYGRADKTDMMNRSGELMDDNLSDALLLLEYTTAHYDTPQTHGRKQK
ncbi:hypothetical protein HUU59_11055 [bacterium]|nr:hypothetical protein [bacterium]